MEELVIEDTIKVLSTISLHLTKGKTYGGILVVVGLYSKKFWITKTFVRIVTIIGKNQLAFFLNTYAHGLV